MKDDIVLLDKKLGETPLETILRYKQAHHLDNEKISFAGRLDPMAEGLLLVLRGDENKNRKVYEDLDKTYLFSFVTGFATDTYDLLGKVVDHQMNATVFSDMQVMYEKLVTSLPGKRTVSYPPYSSYHIKGKPLFYLARKGELPKTLPTKEITITKAEVLDHTLLTKETFQNEITKRIGLVKGNFRQEEILAIWKDTLSNTPFHTFLQTHAKVVCSSGTYVRQIVKSLGDQIDIPTVTFSIKRIGIGPYTIADCE